MGSHSVTCQPTQVNTPCLHREFVSADRISSLDAANIQYISTHRPVTFQHI